VQGWESRVGPNRTCFYRRNWRPYPGACLPRAGEQGGRDPLGRSLHAYPRWPRPLPPHNFAGIVLIAMDSNPTSSRGLKVLPVPKYIAAALGSMIGVVQTSGSGRTHVVDADGILFISLVLRIVTFLPPDGRFSELKAGDDAGERAQ